MQDFSPEGRQALQNIANAHGVSLDAVETLARAVAAGNGTMAQFSHPELGGMGQWSQGGMIMIGDMFNNGLKYRVSQICDELSNLMRSQTIFLPPPPPAYPPQSFQSQQFQQQGGGVSFLNPNYGGSYGSWWPSELGSPGSSGSQNNLNYAYFPAAHRLAIQCNGAVTVYDTLDHMIGGFSQQQGGDQSLTFNSQYGLVRVADLPVVSGAGQNVAPQNFAPAPSFVPPAPVLAPEPAPVFAPAPAPVLAPEPAPAQNFAPAPTSGEQDIFAAIEKLAGLRDKNILSEDEFSRKKAELLSRL